MLVVVICLLTQVLISKVGLLYKMNTDFNWLEKVYKYLIC